MRIVKVPYAQGSLDKNNGCEQAPDQILNYLKEHIWASEDNKPMNFEIIESGVTPNDTFEQMEQKLSTVNGDLFIGGDHSITYALFKQFATKHANPGLIVFDAHPECYKEFDYPTHGDWLYWLVEKKLIKPENIILVGLRSSEASEINYLKQKGIKYFTMKQLFNNHEHACDSIMELSRPCDALYVSIDIDVLDPAFAPGTGYPSPGGLSTRELIYFLQRLQRLKNITCVDIMEVNPTIDVNKLTINTAAKIIGEFM